MKLRSIEGQRRKLDSVAALVRFGSDLLQDITDGTLAPEIGRIAWYGISIQKTLVEADVLEQRIAALEGHGQRFA